MRKFMVGLLLLVVAACRSLPQETVDAVAISNAESAAIVSIWNDKVVPEKGQNGTIDVNALAVQFADHVHKLFVARDQIQQYLDGSNGDSDAALGFRVATDLLMDIDANINMVFATWDKWIDPAVDAEQFIADINKMISDFQLLNRKFNEWANQFGVK
jgi:hypothetical protein